MNDDDKRRAQALVNKLLKEAEEKTKGGDYRSALTAVRKAKALDQGNVFLLALERQVEQIGDLAMTGTLTEAQKIDILDSVPRLIGQSTNSDSVLAQGASEQSAEDLLEARTAAGRWLKNQYFQRSHDYVRSGDYEHALMELRKIFSIDDQDKVAREFEMKIMQMLELKRHQPPVLQSEVPAPPVRRPGEPADEETGQESRPGIARSGRRILLYAIGLTMAAVVLAVVYFWNRHQSPPPKPHLQESIIEKPGEQPMYPVPPTRVGADSTARDTTAKR
jgi:hypothetical protein